MDFKQTVLNSLKKSGALTAIRKGTFVLLAGAVSATAFWQLKYTGITMTEQPLCNKVEHIHSAECPVKSELKCQIESVSTSEAETEAHSEDAAFIHTHNDSCYESKYDCGYQDEHKHAPECYNDIHADVETAAVWEKTLPELKGRPTEDLANVALSQVGYKESTANCEFDKITEDTFSERGYTRYGAWAGSPYTDNWSPLFAAFCLYYAGIENHAQLSNPSADAMAIQWQNLNLYLPGADDSVQRGDVLFLDKNNSGEITAVGIVTKAEGSSLKAVFGNEEEKVKEISLAKNDTRIVGIGRLPKQEKAKAEETAAAEAETEAAASEDAGAEKAEETADVQTEAEEKSELAKDNRDAALVGDPYVMTFGSSEYASIAFFASLFRTAEPEETQVVSAGGDHIDLRPYLTKVDGQGTALNPPYFSTSLSSEFTIPASVASQVTPDSGRKLIWYLPENILLTDKMIDGVTHTAFKQGTNQPAFYYTFVKDDKGNFQVEIQFNKEYAADAQGSDITNTMQFSCLIDGNSSNEDGSVDVHFRDDLTLHIPPTKVETVTDLTTKKEGYFDEQNKQLVYRVKVSSVNGTPDKITFKDTLSVHQLDGILSAPTLGNVLKIDQNNPNGSKIDVNAQITQMSDNQWELNMTLDQLGAGESYVIEYVYQLNNLAEDPAINIGNTVHTSSSKDKDYKESNDSSHIYRDKKKTVKKYGHVKDSEIEWTIHVNEGNGNIADKKLTDEMFKDAVNGPTIVKVEKGEYGQNVETAAVEGVDYIVLRNESGQITGYQFKSINGANKNYYIVRYSTKAESNYDETTTVKNTVHFEGDKDETSVHVPGGDIHKNYDDPVKVEDGKYHINWTIQVDAPVSGIPENTEFTDTLSPNGHYMTTEQWTALEAELKKVWGADNIKEITPVYAGSDQSKITGYSFKTTANAVNIKSTQIKWNYTTTAEVGNQTQTFVNEFKSGKKKLHVEVEINPNKGKVRKLSVMKNSGDLTDQDTELELKDYENQTFGWAFEIETTKGVLEYDITDDLPEGVEVQRVVVSQNKGSWHLYTNDESLTVNVPTNGGNFSKEVGWNPNTLVVSGEYVSANSGDTLKLNLKKSNSNSDQTFMDAKHLYVYIVCKLKSNAYPEPGATIKYKFDNKVSVHADKNDYGSADNTIHTEVQREKFVVHKGGSWDGKQHTANYEIEINPLAEDLLEGEDYLNFKDTLTYTAKLGNQTGSAILSMDSVKLEKKVNGVWVPIDNLHWKAETIIDKKSDQQWDAKAVIEMQIPDSTHLRLSYSYTILSTLSTGMNLKNKAEIDGVSHSSSDKDININKDDFTHSAASIFRLFQLAKVDADSSKALQGAEFTVQKYTANGWVDYKTFVTDEKGLLSLQFKDAFGNQLFEYNTAYRIYETKAPEGYELPEVRENFYFWFSDGQTDPTHMPEDFPSHKTDVSHSSVRVSAINKRTSKVILPETGGMGTTLYASSGALILGASMILLIAKRRAAR
ncbi:MAG: LPXTG cell wall anchor domain-containing protein [Erysipelotrichaceae bacterium]|nr:LPXTG cell wall anchor domain-containing protein [Erysipelotrichaceae bacterium]